MNLSIFNPMAMFKDIPLGSEFQWQGTTWKKVSSRTAKVGNRTFYFAQKDWCRIN